MLSCKRKGTTSDLINVLQFNIGIQVTFTVCSMYSSVLYVSDLKHQKVEYFSHHV